MATVNIRTKDIEKIARLQCTMREAAAFLGIPTRRFKELVRDNELVSDAWERGQNMGLISLRRKQSLLAGTNASMAIFLGKQYLKQRDVITSELIGDGGGPVEFNVDKLSQAERDELRQLITRSTQPSRTAERD